MSATYTPAVQRRWPSHQSFLKDARLDGTGAIGVAERRITQTHTSRPAPKPSSPNTTYSTPESEEGSQQKPASTTPASGSSQQPNIRVISRHIRTTKAKYKTFFLSKNSNVSEFPTEGVDVGDIAVQGDNCYVAKLDEQGLAITWDLGKDGDAFPDSWTWWKTTTRRKASRRTPKEVRPSADADGY
ncbi:hypothetical protein DL93DRAFT_1098745 [Clavulina sp. PMI_390]|nr:hypothetical protein DL93DRAFT_1098745 [Clavulina sp. PMI_390]